jgi:NTP pyrophosphatase (non-canonical NTP hydrolase)
VDVSAARGPEIAPPYSIGSRTLPGLSRLLEEAGEVVQVLGKIIGAGHVGRHWDGTDLGERLRDELADLAATIRFVIEANGFNSDPRLAERVGHKLRTYHEWHEQWLAKLAPSVDEPPTWCWNDGDYAGGSR